MPSSTQYVGVGQILMAIGLGVAGVANLRSARQPVSGSGGIAGLGKGSRRQQGPLLPSVGRRSSAQPQGPAQTGPVVVGKHQVGDIKHRVSFIVERILKGGTDPDIHMRAVRILSTKRRGASGGVEWAVPENDWRGENELLFRAVRTPGSPLAVRYTRDPVFADLFRAPRVTLDLQGGDCDDHTITLGAALLAVGHPVKVRVVQTDDEATWNHVYLLARSDMRDPNKWMALDTTTKHPPGWQLEGSDEAARTGKASGRVKRARDFEVTPDWKKTWDSAWGTV